MTKQQAIDFINAVNAVQPYVPPFLFNAVLNSEVSRLALVVANDAVICDVRLSDLYERDTSAQEVTAWRRIGPRWMTDRFDLTSGTPRIILAPGQFSRTQEIGLVASVGPSVPQGHPGDAGTQCPKNSRGRPDLRVSWVQSAQQDRRDRNFK